MPIYSGWFFFYKIHTLLINQIIWSFAADQFRYCLPYCFRRNELTHWGRVTHICVSKLTIIGSDNGLSPGRRQAIIWTNAGILSIRTLGTHFSEILSEIHAFSFKKMHFENDVCEIMSIVSRPQYLNLCHSFCKNLCHYRRFIGPEF